MPPGDPAVDDEPQEEPDERGQRLDEDADLAGLAAAVGRLAEEHPGLTDHGLPGPGWRRPSWVRSDAPPSARDVTRALAALAACEPLPPRSRRIPSSYGLKHRLEADGHGYFSNEAMIAAALLAGFRVRPVAGSPNPDVFAALRPIGGGR